MARKAKTPVVYPESPEVLNPLEGIVLEPGALQPLNCVFQDDDRGIWLYHGNCLDVMDATAAKYPEGRFDMIFADPPYFLSNGGITCHAGKMVKVDKGDWDKSRGPELNHEFNTEWLRRCQRVLKPNGTIWVTGTHHVIFSIGYAMQQLGFKILNSITWEKPNPPPNLSCRYFTHSTETLLWAAKTEKSKHLFNYQEMRRAAENKQMKTVWREKLETPYSDKEKKWMQANEDFIWNIPPPRKDEKIYGKHPTQKPVALLERILLASTRNGDLVLDPFLGSGTTAVACLRLSRNCIGIEMETEFLKRACYRTDGAVIDLWIRSITVKIQISVISINDLDLFEILIDRSGSMGEQPELKSEKIFHESKFVFLSCAHVKQAGVVHTTVETSIQEAWCNTPNSKRRETTHILHCRTEIHRVKNS